MVTSNLAFKEKNSIEPEVVVNESPVKWCAVALSDVVARGKRLEAKAFDVEAKQVRESIANHGQGCYLCKEVTAVAKLILTPFSVAKGSPTVSTRNTAGLPFSVPANEI